MATSTDIWCVLCKDKDKTKHADYWCPECEEGFCLDCLKFHESSNATKCHDVISTENVTKPPPSISSIDHHCREHDKGYQYYCSHHDSLCCQLCIATHHNKCIDLLAIDEMIKTAKFSSLLESIEESIDVLKWNLQLLLVEGDKNIVGNKTHRESVLENLKTLRKKTMAHFNQLEEQIAHEILVAEKRIKDQNDNLSKDLKRNLQSVEKLEYDLGAIKKHGSDLQTFLGSISLKTRIEDEERYLKSLEENGKLKQFILKCSLDEQLLADILSVETLGSVSTYEISSTIDLNIQAKKRAQLALGPTPVIPKSIDEITFTFQCKFEIPVGKTSDFITGCVFRPYGEIFVILRNEKRLIVFDENRKLRRTINLPSDLRPTDVTSVDDKTFCVSYWQGNRLDLINSDSYETIQTIKTIGSCCGVTSEQGTLYWYEKNKGIQMKKQSSDHITTLAKADDDCYWCYLSVYKGRIYQTNEQKKTVCCFTCDGQKIWEFKDTSILACPEGIAVDGASNVYVADFYKGILVLSADGQNFRQILGINHEICYLHALDYDRIHNILLVCNKNGPAFLYNIS